MVQTFKFVDQPKVWPVKCKLSVILFIEMYKVVPSFVSVGEILKCDHSNESYCAVLSCCAVYYDVQSGSPLCVCLWKHSLRIQSPFIACGTMGGDCIRRIVKTQNHLSVYSRVCSIKNSNLDNCDIYSFPIFISETLTRTYVQ